MIHARKDPFKRSRIRYASAAVIVMVTGILWRSVLFPLPSVTGKYGGDALWALLVFIGFGGLFNTASTLRVAVASLGFAWLTEFSQLYHAPWTNSIRDTLIGRLVLGSTFNPPDLLAYVGGIALGAWAEHFFPPLLAHRFRQITPSKNSRKLLSLLSLALLIFLLSAPIKTERGFICRHTLSQHEYTEWLGLVRSNERYIPSPIEAYLEKNKPERLTHNWVSYNGTGKNVFGTAMVFSHGRPGDILQLQRHAFPHLQTLTDKQKDDIATTLKSEDEAAIKAMVESVLTEVMKQP